MLVIIFSFYIGRIMALSSIYIFLSALSGGFDYSISAQSHLILLFANDDGLNRPHYFHNITPSCHLHNPITHNRNRKQDMNQ